MNILNSRERIAKERPLFTIAIPTYNRAHWLCDCVRGALNQEFHSFEVVVSDNASEDNTAEILKEFSDERLVVIKQKSNIGQVGNFNACLAAARGIFFVVVCDDDFVYSHFLKRCGALVGGDADIPVIVALGDVVDGKRGTRRPATISRHLKSGACNGTDILVEFLADRISPQLCTVVMKTESLRAIGGFPADYPHMGDLACWVPMLLHGRAGFVNESCGAYRSHEGTLTAASTANVRINDFYKLSNLIIVTAEENVCNPRLLNLIRRKLRRYLSRNVIGQLAMERRKGLSRRRCLSVGWEWRRHLLHFGPSYFPKLCRPFLLFILPLGISRMLGNIRRMGVLFRH